MALPPRQSSCLVAIALWCCLGVAEAQREVQLSDADVADMIEGEEKLLYPIHFSSMPLSTPAQSSLESPAFGKNLAKIGYDMYKKYRDTILPRELQKDKKLAKEFGDSDHSRVNLAFLRWQKRTYMQRTRVDATELTGRGEPAPKLPGINYTWPELYGSPLFKQLQKRFAQVSKLYLKRTGYAKEDIPSQLRIFVFVEVYEKGDSQRPWARTDGGHVMGRYFAKARTGGQKFNFEDPRGINPPYGKTYSHNAFEGNVVMFPTWVSHFITPNMFDEEQVCFAFIVYSQDGNSLDYEDDKTGDLVVENKVMIPLKGEDAFYPIT